MFDAINRSMAVIEFTPDGNVISANENFLRTMGYRLEDIRNRHHRMFCNDAFYREQPDFWDRLTTGDLHSGQFQRRRADGTTVWLEASYNPIFDEQGRTEKVIRFATDITERVERAIQTQDTTAIASATTTQTAAIAERAAASLTRSLETSRRIEQGVDSSKTIISELNEQSQNIEKIVDTITAVAGEGKSQVGEVERIVKEIRDGAQGVIDAVASIRA